MQEICLLADFLKVWVNNSFLLQMDIKVSLQTWRGQVVSPVSGSNISLGVVCPRSDYLFTVYLTEMVNALVSTWISSNKQGSLRWFLVTECNTSLSSLQHREMSCSFLFSVYWLFQICFWFCSWSVWISPFPHATYSGTVEKATTEDDQKNWNCPRLAKNFGFRPCF